MSQTKKKAAKPAQTKKFAKKTDVAYLRKKLMPTLLALKKEIEKDGKQTIVLTDIKTGKVIGERGASNFSTAELTTVLANRGLAVSRPGELLIATKDEAIALLSKQGFSVSKQETTNIPVKSEPKKENKPRLHEIFDNLRESNSFLEDSVIVLEKTAKNLFGYADDYKPVNEVDVTNANQHFALHEEARTILTGRLARVTNALSDFIG